MIWGDLSSTSFSTHAEAAGRKTSPICLQIHLLAIEKVKCVTLACCDHKILITLCGTCNLIIKPTRQQLGSSGGAFPCVAAQQGWLMVLPVNQAEAGKPSFSFSLTYSGSLNDCFWTVIGPHDILESGLNFHSLEEQITEYSEVLADVEISFIS